MTKPVLSYVNNKDADQRAHLCSQISIFVIIIILNRPIVTIFQFPRPLLASGRLSLTWSQTSEDRFSRDIAQVWKWLFLQTITDQCCNVRDFHKMLLFKFVQLGYPTSNYRKNPKNLDTKNNCCNYLKIGTLSFYYRVMGPKDADRMANDQTAQGLQFAQTCLSKNLDH